MLFTIIGGALGFAFGCFRADDKKDIISIGFNIFGICFWTGVGTALGFGLGGGLLASGKHPFQNI